MQLRLYLAHSYVVWQLITVITDYVLKTLNWFLLFELYSFIVPNLERQISYKNIATLLLFRSIYY